MKLRELLDQCRCFEYEGSLNPDILGVSSDSRKVSEGDIFIAIAGYRDDGTRYVEDAVRKGARAVVVETRSSASMFNLPDVPICTTSSSRRCALLISRTLKPLSDKSMALIGVTGTNGKTTITYLLESMLRWAGHSPGVIGTITYRWGANELKAHNTTPDPIEIQELLSRMADDGVTHVIMEVSSHALAMDRVYPPDFGAAVFTNLSQDHLDFHATMDDYFDAKALLFEGLGKEAHAVINIDDAYGKRLLMRTDASVVTYGMDLDAAFHAHDLELSIDGTDFCLNGRPCSTELVGEHNVYNILAAAACASVLGIGDETVSEALGAVRRIPGRFERVEHAAEFHVFVDYAHTPDALAHLLDAANTLKRARIITVFGCGGDRDRGKRPKMGRIVEQNSDVAIVTSDNPRTEDPLAIIEDIGAGLKGDEHLIIPDRRDAIYRAIELAEEDDIVLIAGKGHEEYQILGSTTIHFDDREVAAQAIADLKGK
jgi:UDP-N-acetylmuramoyl-L-alanyl-D-glutamate--2,6-diaminopimelate ligase